MSVEEILADMGLSPPVPYIAFRQLTPMEKIVDRIHGMMAIACALPLHVLLGQVAPLPVIVDRDPGDESDYEPFRGWTVKRGATFVAHSPTCFDLVWKRHTPHDDHMGDCDSYWRLVHEDTREPASPALVRMVRGYWVDPPARLA